MKLMPDHIRTALLHAQGLIELPSGGASKEDLRSTIRQMHVLQIDTISVVNRSPYLVLHSRVGTYPQQWLTDLLAERAIFEYWSHAASFLPIEDFRHYRPFMLHRRTPESRTQQWLIKSEAQSAIDHVRQTIREKGEVRSADFERKDGQKGTWWEWKAEKVALEYLFDIGELMVIRRDGFQRVYAPQEHAHPWDDSRTQTVEESHKAWIEQTALALGAARAAWFADYFRLNKADALKVLKVLVDEGVIVEVSVEGETVPYYMHRDAKTSMKKIADGAIVPERTVLLSPFDPIVWDRNRLLAMFGMDYKIEVYTPEAKRKYGYFSLPILHGNRMVGRLDPKAHRAQGRFEVKAIHLEPGVVIDDGLVQGLAGAIRDFADWHGTPLVEIGTSNPAPLSDALRATGKF
jgi:uncharacterized protein YcaQ